MSNSQLYSSKKLATTLELDQVRVLDCSWYLPSQNRDTYREYVNGHIPNAQFFDIDDVCDRASPLPHMLPTASEFGSAVGALGVSNDDLVVVYDSSGLFSAARVWWMFKVFGHTHVKVLDGGLPAWLASGAKVSQSMTPVVAANFMAELDQRLVSNKQQLIVNSSTNQSLILDARPTERFLGQAPEPRPGLPSGHMPDSISLPFNQVLNNGRLKPRAELLTLFKRLNVNAKSNIVTSCGSGVTAAIITLALVEAGYGLKPLYDGSWAEWGSASDTVILDNPLSE